MRIRLTRSLKKRGFDSGVLGERGDQQLYGLIVFGRLDKLLLNKKGRKVESFIYDDKHVARCLKEPSELLWQ